MHVSYVKTGMKCYLSSKICSIKIRYIYTCIFKRYIARTFVNIFRKINDKEENKVPYIKLQTNCYGLCWQPWNIKLFVSIRCGGSYFWSTVTWKCHCKYDFKSVSRVNHKLHLGADCLLGIRMDDPLLNMTACDEPLCGQMERPKPGRCPMTGYWLSKRLITAHHTTHQRRRTGMCKVQTSSQRPTALTNDIWFPTKDWPPQRWLVEKHWETWIILCIK